MAETRYQRLIKCDSELSSYEIFAESLPLLPSDGKIPGFQVTEVRKSTVVSKQMFEITLSRSDDGQSVNVFRPAFDLTVTVPMVGGLVRFDRKWGYEMKCFPVGSRIIPTK